MEVRVHDEDEETTDPGSRGRTVPLPSGVANSLDLFDWLVSEHAVTHIFIPALGWKPISLHVGKPQALGTGFFTGIFHARAAGKREAAASSQDSTLVLAAERAFQLSYQNVGNVEALHMVLQYTLDMKSQCYAPAIGLFQSSGWGKSRTVCEMWRKDVWVVYCSFANPSGSAYPQRSGIAGWFLKRGCELLGSAAGLEGQLACMNFSLFFFIACIQKVEKSISLKESCESFVTNMWKGGQDYWKAVRSEIESFQANEKMKGLASLHDTEDLTWKNWEERSASLLQTLCKSTRKLGPKRLHILFVFDEARHLVKSNLFLPIRRSTRALHQLGICVLFMDTSAEITNFAPPDSADASDRVLFMDTSAEITNFAPPDSADASDRVSAGQYQIAPPIWGCFSADSSDEDDPLPLFTTNTFHNIVHPIRAVQYGRPLWWAIFKASLPPKEDLSESSIATAFDESYKLARDKLLGGRGRWVRYIDNQSQLTADAALSLLGATIGIDVDPRSKFASELVANNLLTVVSVSPSRELVWTAWNPEPLVAMGATEAVRKLHKAGRYQELYSPLVEGLQAGWVDKGYQGELAARIILLHAMDKAVESESSGCCTVDVFCKHLLGQSLLELVALERKPTETERKLAGAKLHFNSFHRIYKKSSELDFDDIRMCIERKCALVCFAGTWGDDMWMFAFTGSDGEELREDNVTVIHCQVKLKIGNDTHICLAKISPQYSGLKVASNLPYLSLYMNVMDKGKKEVQARLVDPGEIASSVKNCNLRPIQEALKEIQKEQESSEQPKDDFMGTEGQEMPTPAEVMDIASTEQSEAHFIDTKCQEPADVMDIKGGPKKKKPAVQAWKAWLEAERELQTVVVVKGLNGFSLDAKLKDELMKIVRASKNPFYTDPKHAFHQNLLVLQKAKLKDMFKFVNLHNYE